ncbi:MAG TPA: hypothetical protein VIY47_04490, partial [Ignavibacteriaceae bacterium]
RAWGFNPLNARQNFIFNELQNGFFDARPDNNTISFKLIRYGHYFELSIQNVVILTLMDYTYTGNNMGLYACSSRITLQRSILSILPDPIGEYASQEEAHKIQ